MEPHHNSDSKFASEGEVEPSSTSCSRVSNSLLQSDCSKFGDNRGLDDFDPVIGSKLCQILKQGNFSVNSHLKTLGKLVRGIIWTTGKGMKKILTLRENNILRCSEKLISSNWDKREKSGSEAFGQSAGPINNGKYFYYDSPLFGETGAWIPVSVPPMSESEHEEWNRGFCSNGGYLPEGDTDWNQCMGEEKELTMWDVVVDMLLAARGGKFCLCIW
ncbi:hypothetical protein HAX54_012452 [Datura stramonium]|uniref:Uncharacterized protein n=1 Tax=Datura stramonium TaxID=4076 RepID=A0ABS8TLM7_DATST|nr:hypothetical protein [Datura stramonium]